MARKILIALAVLGLAASFAHGSEHSSVVDLTSSTYEDAVSCALRAARPGPRSAGLR